VSCSNEWTSSDWCLSSTERNLPIPNRYDTKRAPVCVRTLYQREKFLSLPRNWIPVVQSVTEYKFAVRATLVINNQKLHLNLSLKTELMNKLPALKEFKSSSPCSQNPSLVRYPDSVQSTPHIHILFLLRSILILSPYLRLRLMNRFYFLNKVKVKVKLSLCFLLTEYHTIDAYWGLEV